MDADVERRLWYPDESVCRNNRFNNLTWIMRQKSLKRGRGTVDQGLFSVSMLSKLNRISKKTNGRNPDSNLQTLDWWMGKYTRKEASPVLP